MEVLEICNHYWDSQFSSNIKLAIEIRKAKVDQNLYSQTVSILFLTQFIFHNILLITQHPF